MVLSHLCLRYFQILVNDVSVGRGYFRYSIPLQITIQISFHVMMAWRRRDKNREKTVPTAILCRSLTVPERSLTVPERSCSVSERFYNVRDTKCDSGAFCMRCTIAPWMDFFRLLKDRTLLSQGKSRTLFLGYFSFLYFQMSLKTWLFICTF